MQRETSPPVAGGLVGTVLGGPDGFVVPPPPGPIMPELVESSEDSVAKISQKQSFFALKKGEFTDNILRESDDYYWSLRSYLPFSCHSEPLFLLALYLTDESVVFPDDKDGLFLSTTTLTAPKAVEMGAINHHVTIIPTVESIAEFASFSLCSA